MIYYLTINELNDKNILNSIYSNKEENYYWSDDFSNEFYIKLAESGFITTSMYSNEKKFVLLPEIQFEYAILDFKDIKINKKIKKLLKEEKYIFTINEKFDEVCENINIYHKDSWLNNDYMNIVNNIRRDKSLNNKFKFISVELSEKATNKLISGEIGYKMGKIYTSLTGFTTRDKEFNNWGKLQLVLLNKFLEKKGYSFWNLGHPQLKYKIDLGAKIYSRDTFLKRFFKEK